MLKKKKSKKWKRKWKKVEKKAEVLRRSDRPAWYVDIGSAVDTAYSTLFTSRESPPDGGGGLLVFARPVPMLLPSSKKEQNRKMNLDNSKPCEKTPG